MTDGMRCLLEADRLRTLTRLSQVLSSSLDVDAILREIALAAVELTDARVVSLWVADEESRTITLRAFSDEAIGADHPARRLRYGEGGAGRVALERCPLEVPDLRTDRQIVARDWLLAHHLRSVYAVPILHEDTLLGVLAMLGERPFSFSDEDRDLLEAFVAQAALAIRNARVFAASEARRREAEALADVGRILAQTLDPGAAARCMVESLCRLLAARWAALYRLAPESGDLVVETVAGERPPDSALPPRLPQGTGIAGCAAGERRPLASPDVLADARCAPPPARAALADAPHRALLAVPVAVQERVFGVLVAGDATGRVFTPEEMRLAQAFTDQAALALENARLFEDTELRRREAEVLAELARQIGASLDLDVILDRVAAGARELCGADGARIVLREGSGRFVARRASGVEHRSPPAAGVTVREAAEGVVLGTGRPFRTEDYARDPRIGKALADAAAAEGIVAEMIVPVRNGRIEGLLYVHNRTARPFTDRDELVLSRLASQAAIAIENARLFQEAERRRRAAEALAEVGSLVSRSLEPKDVVASVVASVCRLTGARMAALYRLEQETEELALLAGVGLDVEWNERLTPGTATAGLAVRDREPVTTHDVLADPRITLTPEARGRIERSGYRAVLALPLLVNDVVIGALVVGDQAARAFEADEIRLAQAFADQAAVALENARLYAEATRRRWEAEVLGDVGRLFAQSLDPEEVARRTAESLRGLLGAKAAVVCRLDAQGGALVLRSSAGNALGLDVVLSEDAGAMGLAIRERGPVVTPNILTDPRITLPPALYARIEQTAHRAVLAVPLLVKGAAIGAIAIGDVEGRRFDSDEVRLAQTFADHAALALEHARLFEDGEQRRREAEAFAELGRQINSSLELDDVLERLGVTARALCGADFAWVALREPGGDAMVLRYRHGARLKGYDSIRIEPGRGLGGRVLASGRLCRTDDYAGDPELTKDYLELARGEGIVTGVAVPIRIDDRIEGLLYAHNRSPRPFTSQDEVALTRLADQAAVAIKNGRLLDALKRYQARLEALLEVSRELSRIQPVDVLLGAIARACGRVLDSNSVGFRLVEGEELVICGAWGDAAAAMVTPRLGIGQGLSGTVAATGEPLAVNDALADPRPLPVHREAMARLGYRAWLGVPVKAGERVIGVLSARTRRAEGFREEDVAIATAFASQAATALENARLFQEIEQAYTAVSRAKEELVQAQKMEAIGRLAGGIAHDFNNLLTIVHGRCEILRKRLAPGDVSLRDIEIVRQTTRRAAALISQLLAFSRKQVLKPQVVGMNALVRDSAVLFRRLLGEDVDLVLATDAARDRVKADPTQLEQVLMNLAVNARDAMPRGGRLTIGTASVELDEAFAHQHPGARPGPHLALSVSDTGVGMSPEVQARIFEPFFTTKEPGRGTGLGLSTVYGIVKQHNGYLNVASECGAGATFTIYLPRAEGAEDMVTPERSESAAPRGSETVLLVEDEDEVRELTREILEMNGYRVLEAACGTEALGVCRRHAEPIHLLLTDVVMPGGMSGRDLARQVADLSPLTKVVYMSGYSDDALGNHGVLDPDVVLLPKPFTPEALLGALRRVLEGPAAPGGGA